MQMRIMPGPREETIADFERRQPVFIPYLTIRTICQMAQALAPVICYVLLGLDIRQLDFSEKTECRYADMHKGGETGIVCDKFECKKMPTTIACPECRVGFGLNLESQRSFQCGDHDAYVEGRIRDMRKTSIGKVNDRQSCTNAEVQTFL